MSEEINKEIIEDEENTEDFLSSDERYIELEIQKELLRMEREAGYNKGILKEIKDKELLDKYGTSAVALGLFYQQLIKAGLSNIQAYSLLLEYSTQLHNQKMVKLDTERAKVQTNVANQNTL